MTDVRRRAAQNEGHRQAVGECAIEHFMVFNLIASVAIAKPSPGSPWDDIVMVGVISNVLGIPSRP